MAKATRDVDGWRTSVTIDRKRSTVRLGGADLDETDAALRAKHVRALAVAHRLGNPIEAAQVRWLERLDSRLRDRLAELGLAPAAERVEVVTLGGLWDRLTQTQSIAPSTALVYGRVRASMEACMDASTPIRSIGREAVDKWGKQLSDDEFATATRSKYLQVGATLFGRALAWGLIDRSPFEGVRFGPQSNSDRERYISREDVRRVMDGCHTGEWRCILALSRFGGLRVPSELADLKWSDVNFETKRLTVRSPKTAHHGANGQSRTIPIDPALYAVLLDAHSAAEPGAVYVCPAHRLAPNLTTHARRLFARASVQTPPKPFNNLRASCVSDWASTVSGAAAARWAGHSVAIAVKHYARVRDADFEAVSGRDVEPRPCAPCRKGEDAPARPPARTGTESGGCERMDPDLSIHPEGDSEACFPGFSDDTREYPSGATDDSMVATGLTTSPVSCEDSSTSDLTGTPTGTLPRSFVSPVRQWLGL